MTRGALLRVGLGIDEFRECLRRMGAWKGYKLWALPKEELAAISAAYLPVLKLSSPSHVDLSSIPTLSSICKAATPNSSPARIQRRARSPSAFSPSPSPTPTKAVGLKLLVYEALSY